MRSRASRWATLKKPELMGRVIDERAQASILEYIKIGSQEARVVVEGRVSQPGWYVAPTVFADVKPTARIAQEEIFGPVLAVMRAESFDEALTAANGTDYALTGESTRVVPPASSWRGNDSMSEISI